MRKDVKEVSEKLTEEIPVKPKTEYGLGELPYYSEEAVKRSYPDHRVKEILGEDVNFFDQALEEDGDCLYE